MIRSSALVAVTVVAALVAATPVQAQRATRAERVERLERQQAQPAGGAQSIELVNRINELQAEIGMLRGQLEQQAFELEELGRRNRQQYLDLDGRIERLQGGAPTPGATAADEPGFAPVERGAENDRVGARVPLAGTGGTQDAPAPADPAGERAAYEAGFDALKDGRYAEAARRFQAFTEMYPDGEYAANAYYWLGESYYVTQNYEIALQSFQALLERYPDSAKAPDALLKLGYCQYELRDWAAAERTLNQVVQRYPDTIVARLAQGRLRALMLENR